MDEQIQQPNKLLEYQNIYNKDGFWLTANLYGTAPATAGNYGLFFTALWPVEVMMVAVVWQTAGTSPTLQIEKLTGTQALDAGVTVLSAAVDMSTTANTVAYPVLTATVGNRLLVKGDRLALKDAGTLTNTAGVQVTLYMRRLGKGHYN